MESFVKAFTTSHEQFRPSPDGPLRREKYDEYSTR
jgi:hypothetical protein